ncbi:MAG TPA: bifunctional phosphopantothenoylcysteine decarboxylase/phosphopantothenate--cysteine ligase CoaBC [Trueperaceae bacterium]|nr:bifunctional phosphopantothenoylcysteine decarboxylase/phosphopantothenate--cysteine ligase CoaBC [Trueperaceae bacterium]
MSRGPSPATRSSLRLVVAAAGGVAALKTPSLIRRLRRSGCEVRAAATADAYAFVTRLSLAVAAGGEVFDRESWFAADGGIRHLDWAGWADGLVVAPATADVLASAAQGRVDNVVSALIAGGTARVLWAPAMNPAMWTHPPVQRNVAALRELGHGFVGPVEGPLAGADEGEGPGRMADVDAIASAAFGLRYGNDLAGARVLVSAGPTHEYLDPVRFLGNPSSGKTGYAVAAAAQARGAEVTLVSGPTTLPDPPGVRVERVVDANGMAAALDAHFDACEVLVMSAAVADWRPRDRSERKEAKSDGQRDLALVRTPDILALLAERRSRQVMVGFAMETHQGVERAAAKARAKGLAFILLNYPSPEGRGAAAAGGGVGFGLDASEVTLVTPDGSSEPWPRLSKRDLADALLDRVRPLLAGGVR